MEDILLKYRYHFLLILVGLILVSGGYIFFKKSFDISPTKVEILSSSGESLDNLTITAEIAGAVINPGVYKLPGNSRIDDLLIVGGGYSANADRVWAEKYLNRAAKLTDGQKIYIPIVGEHSDSATAKNGGGYQTMSSNFSSDSNQLININTASLSELDTLSGIGPVYAQKIIDHRPYSKPEDLVENSVMTQTLYEKIKDQVTVY